MKNTKGITLIALIITIIVMLILVSVSINVALDTGLFKSASDATKNWKTAQEEESAGVIEIDGKKYNSIEDYLAGKEAPVDWDKVLADATANPSKYRHPEQQSTNKDIGIGTDGKPVNLDLWTYYELNENEICLGGGVCASRPGYSNAKIVEGKILGKVPQYIKINGKDEFYTVTSMQGTFGGCTNLEIAPEIPLSVTNMNSTFYYCSNLMTAPKIPSNVGNLCMAFKYCKKLEIAPEIPSNITDMEETFAGCTNLKTVSKIPSSVTSMQNTFSLCTKLQGIMKIDANPTNYAGCFTNVATEGPGLVVTGESTKLDELIGTKSDDSNITKGK